ERVLDVAVRADDEKERNRFRGLWLNKNTAELAALAEGIDPGTLSPAALCALAKALAGQPEARERLLRRAQARYPADFWLVFDLALLLDSAQKRFGEAEGCYRVALALQPRNELVWNNLGVALGRQGRHKEAEDACREAIRLKPDFPMAHY